MWVGKKRGAMVKKWLDRALVSENWRLKFPEAFVHHLPRILSDHHPLLINSNDVPLPRFTKPFHFEEMWTTHPGFWDFVRWSCLFETIY